MREDTYYVLASRILLGEKLISVPHAWKLRYGGGSPIVKLPPSQIVYHLFIGGQVTSSCRIDCTNGLVPASIEPPGVPPVAFCHDCLEHAVQIGRFLRADGV